jgi:hypothetical protein
MPKFENEEVETTALPLSYPTAPRHLYGSPCRVNQAVYQGSTRVPRGGNAVWFRTHCLGLRLLRTRHGRTVTCAQTDQDRLAFAFEKPRLRSAEYSSSMDMMKVESRRYPKRTAS